MFKAATCIGKNLEDFHNTAFTLARVSGDENVLRFQQLGETCDELLAQEAKLVSGMANANVSKEKHELAERQVFHERC